VRDLFEVPYELLYLRAYVTPLATFSTGFERNRREGTLPPMSLLFAFFAIAKL